MGQGGKGSGRMTTPWWYVLGPQVVSAAVGGSAAAMFAQGMGANVGIMSGTGTIAGYLFGLFIATPATHQATNPNMASVKFNHEEKMLEAKQNVSGELVVRGEIDRAGGYLKVDFFRGLTADQWHRCAVSISAAENFTVRTVGQTEHPVLVPMMLGAEYIERAGQGRYELTDDGLWFWKSLAARPYPWKSVPKSIPTLSMDDIHTQYTQKRRSVLDALKAV